MDYLKRTLEELEQNYWGNIPHDASPLIKTCYKLRHKQLQDFTASDLRILIAQKQSLEYLLPLAITLLEQDAFVEADYYDGDLLVSVLSSPLIFWEKHPQLYLRVKTILIEIKSKIDSLDLLNETKNSIRAFILNYQ